MRTSTVVGWSCFCTKAWASSHILSISLLVTTRQIVPPSTAQTACLMSRTLNLVLFQGGKPGCNLNSVNMFRSRSPDQSIFLHLSGSLGLCDNPLGQCKPYGERAQAALRGIDAAHTWSPASTAERVPPSSMCPVSRSVWPQASFLTILCLCLLFRDGDKNEMAASHGEGFGLWLQDYPGDQTQALSQGGCQNLSFSGFSFLPENIRAWGCPKLTSSPSPSLLFKAWDRNTQAPQRGSCFLQTA